MPPEKPEKGDLIVSRLTNRAYIVESLWDGGYYKCRPVLSDNDEDVEYISAEALHAYWLNLGQTRKE